MTGGSLGLRTGSYGSLQQQSFPLVFRRSSKMPFSISKFLPWICKLFGRRRAGMLILAAVSLLVFLSLLSSLYKEEDAQEVVHVNRMPVQSTSQDGNSGATVINIRSTIEYGEHAKTNDEFRPSNLSLHEIDNHGSLHFPASPPPPSNATLVVPLTVHPCASFVIPPPPPFARRRIGPRPCPVCYLPVEQAKSLMPATASTSPVVKNLTYIVQEENLVQNNSAAGSTFGGYPSLSEREDSYNLKESMTINCGFVRGNKPGSNTGFDIDGTDLLEMEQCNGIVVASAVFGNYDEIQQPRNISDVAKRDVCFFMFVDEETLFFINKTNALDSRRLGLWRVVLVTNLPYTDARRTGKVPKLLLHRLFPNVRFSIWIDGKLELVKDPYQILERFLWRTNATFAISRHYRRFDVFVEAEANKAAGKYDNASIDAQIEFYKEEGLTPYSSAKLPITSDVPEGCVIIREHIPIANLFTCLWFNEVDRFTSRDQLSFSTVRDKIMSKVNWGINMFLDCERRNFVIQAYHRDVLEQRNAMRAAAARLPPVVTGDRHVNLPKPPTLLLNDRVVVRSPVRKLPTKRARERKSVSRRHRSRNAGFRETNFA